MYFECVRVRRCIRAWRCLCECWLCSSHFAAMLCINAKFRGSPCRSWPAASLSCCWQPYQLRADQCNSHFHQKRPMFSSLHHSGQHFNLGKWSFVASQQSWVIGFASHSPLALFLFDITGGNAWLQRLSVWCQFSTTLSSFDRCQRLFNVFCRYQASAMFPFLLSCCCETASSDSSAFVTQLQGVALKSTSSKHSSAQFSANRLVDSSVKCCKFSQMQQPSQVRKSSQMCSPAKWQSKCKQLHAVCCMGSSYAWAC